MQPSFEIIKVYKVEMNRNVNLSMLGKQDNIKEASCCKKTKNAKSSSSNVSF